MSVQGSINLSFVNEIKLIIDFNILLTQFKNTLREFKQNLIKNISVLKVIFVCSKFNFFVVEQIGQVRVGPTTTRNP